MQLTRDEAIRKCRDMWNWIADETEKRKFVVKKHEYFEDGDEEPLNYCFLCEYVAARRCEKCPIDFGSWGNVACEDLDSPYCWWKVEAERNNWQEAAKLAREIANLPEREDETWGLLKMKSEC